MRVLYGDKQKEGYYLGIDPGRDKTGLALVDRTGGIVAVQITRSRGFSEFLPAFLFDKLQVTNFWALRQNCRQSCWGTEPPVKNISNR